MLDVCLDSPEAPFNNLKVLPFLSFFFIYPFSSNFAKYPCTVAVEFKPTAFPISLTDGGYEDAERKILIVYSDKFDNNMIEKNYEKILKIVRVTLPDVDKGKYSHRNYLGGIVKLGLKREKIGDILVNENGADIITIQEFSEVLKKELPSLTRFENSNISIEDLKNMKRQELKIEEVKIIVPSLRLDNIISDLARTSRSKASEIISQERVFVNGQNETKNSKQIKLGDIITIRGKGRFVIKEFTGTTRSGRTVILIEKYV